MAGNRVFANDAAGDDTPDRRVHVLFSELAKATPSALAVVEGDANLTYGELDRRSNRVAHALRARGVAPDELVGLYAERRLETVVAILGILKAGAAYLPLDPGYPAERLGFMLEDARVRMLLAQDGLATHLHAGAVEVLPLEPESASDEPFDAPGNAESLAYVMYTSGSTGRPKGVAIPHRAIVRLVRGATWASFAPDERFLHLSPISFDASTFEIWGPLLNGGSLVVLPALHPSLAEIGEAIRRHGVTTLWLTAGLFHLMVDERLEALRPLRQLLAGGDVLSVPHCRRVLNQLPHLALINGYGPTESTTFACCYRVREPIGASVPIGAAIENTAVYALDEELREVAAGAEGELYIGGLGLARGYLHRPELDAERFLQHERFGRLYRTGDRASIRPDGVVEFRGRVDGQVKIRGFRIELGEIEAALGAHPAVREVAVDVREARAGDKRLCAWIVPAGPGATAPALRAFLLGRLPDYMVPSAFVTLERLPLGATGKVDRRALLAPDQPSPAPGAPPPRTEIENSIAAVWAEVLGARVSAADNFFEIGGTSLSIVEVHSRLEARLGRSVPITRLFEFPTVRSLADHLAGTRQEGANFASGIEDRASRQLAAAARARAARGRT